MICGGIYQFTDYRGVLVKGTMVSVEQNTEGQLQGTFLCHGHAPEIVMGTSDRFTKLTLIGRPASANVGRPRKNKKRQVPA